MLSQTTCLRTARDESNVDRNQATVAVTHVCVRVWELIDAKGISVDAKGISVKMITTTVSRMFDCGNGFAIRRLVYSSSCRWRLHYSHPGGQGIE